MIALNWDVFTDTTATSFNVYRAVPGFVVSFPNGLLPGDTLIFSATSVDVQQITFTSVTLASVVSQFNAQALGAYAAVDFSGTKVIFRARATKKSKFKLYACTFLSHVGQSPRTIVPSLEWTRIDSTPFLENVFHYMYTDRDGTELDSYRVTSSIFAMESLPSLVQFPQIGTDTLCAIEGRVCDSQNRPLVGLVVRAEPRLPETCSDGHQVDVHSSQVYTDGFGRFSIYLPRTRIYLLQMPNVGYNETICVPDLPAVSVNDLIPTVAGRFSPFGDPQ